MNSRSLNDGSTSIRRREETKQKLKTRRQKKVDLLATQRIRLRHSQSSPGGKYVLNLELYRAHLPGGDLLWQRRAHATTRTPYPPAGHHTYTMARMRAISIRINSHGGTARPSLAFLTGAECLHHTETLEAGRVDALCGRKRWRLENATGSFLARYPVPGG
jgi:hypothetical protein